MPTNVKGIPQLRARIEAISDTEDLVKEMAAEGIREIKLETPRRTGNLSRNNTVGNLSKSGVEFINTAGYATFVHEGTRPHDIVARNAKALRIPASGSARLSGSPRSGGQVYFRKKVHHPGTKANPFMVRGLTNMLRHFGFSESLIKVWNRAA